LSWLRFAADEDLDAESSVSQTIIIPTADTATLELQVAVPVVGTAGDFGIWLDDVSLFQFNVMDNPMEDFYQSIQIDVSSFADGAAHSLMLDSIISSGDSTTIYVDDLCLTATYTIQSMARSLSANLLLIDADRNGTLSYEEAVAVIPAFTREEFLELDVNSDQELSEDELTPETKAAGCAPGFSSSAVPLGADLLIIIVTFALLFGLRRKVC
jgi:hypothetical protein